MTGLRRGIGGVIAVYLLASCGFPTDGTSSSNRSPRSLDPLTAAGSAPSTNPSRIDVDLWTADCVRYVQHESFTGDTAMLNLWNSVDRDVKALRAVCEEFSGPDLADLHTLPAAQPASHSATGATGDVLSAGP